MGSTATPRILICKLTAIGDVIHAMPVACALRDAFPQAHLAWLAEGRAGDLLRGHAALDELVIAPRRWCRSPREVWKLRRELRRRRFDVTIDLQGLTKSALAARLSGARRRIGFAGEMGREVSQWLNNELVRVRSEHVVDRYLELLAPLGLAAENVRFDVPRHRADVETVSRWLAEWPLSPRFALVNPGAGWPSKRWPPERYAAVARHLGISHGVRSVVVWAGAEEHGWAETIVAQSPGHAVLATETTLAQLAELARRAALFVGSDTGPLHLAAAVGTPCVGLYGPMPAERNGPYGPQHLAIQKARLGGSSRAKRAADNATMLAIEVSHVTAACDEILGRGAARPRQVA